MSLRDELADLANTLQPQEECCFFHVSQEPFPKELSDRGIYHYTDEDGGIHFTIRVDHPAGMDRGERNGSEA